MATAARQACGLTAFVLVHLSELAHAGGQKELYTTNSICRRKYCVNPIFPGLEDLHRLSKATWVTASLRKAAPSMSFCRGTVNYNPALPAPSAGGATIADLVKKQDNAATTMFFYHLAGMGIEGWDHPYPAESDDDCIKSVWRMSCYTYFPKAKVGSKEGDPVDYLRPCQSSCYNYIRSCQVECCDESVQCTFTHTKMISATTSVETKGYVEHDGPSSLCTGGSTRAGPGALLWLLLAAPLASVLGTAVTGVLQEIRGLARSKVAAFGVLAFITFHIQGCDVDVPAHQVGNWRGQDDYLITYEFIPPGGSAKDAKLNSCAFEQLAQTLQCSGRGVCKAWDAENLNNQLTFCECDRDWADPECRTQRRSQLYAYILSLFMGMFGVDQFYLGFPIVGALKLATLGGFGIWWVIDIVRVGSAPVYAHDFRVANDLPHWGFVLGTLSFTFVLGFAAVFASTMRHRRKKRKEALLLQAEEEARSTQASGKQPGGYGAAQKQGA